MKKWIYRDTLATWLWVGLAAMALWAYVWLRAYFVGPDPVNLGQLMQGLQLHEASQPQESFAKLEGVQVFNFWATWCEVCEQEASAWRQLSSQLFESNARYLGVASYDLQQNWQSSAKTSQRGLAQVFDQNNTLAQFFNVYALPQTLISDSRGRVLRRYKGPMTVERLAELRDFVSLMP